MFGRKKMYKKGLADAMQAYEAFGEKQKAALEYMRKEVREGNKKLEDAISEAVTTLGGSIQGLYDHLSSKEKAALYQISTPMDIKEIPDVEKRYLLAILYQLADDEGEEVTEDQRAYIRSVKRYLEITNPQTDADLSAVENIDSVDVQKAFLQVVLEFFYLQDSDTLSDSQEEFLGCFSINKKQAELIEVRVSRLYNAMGAQGLAEKYGYVPEEEPEKESFVLESAGEDSNDVSCTEKIGSAGVIADIIADSIYWQLKDHTYIETEDYFIFEEVSSEFKGVEILSRCPKDICAINKVDGSKKCLVPFSKFPYRYSCEIEKWQSYKNSIYALFSDEWSANPLASVYIIDVLTGEITPANFAVHSWNTCATNGRFFSYSQDYGELSCVDLHLKKKYRLTHKDHDQNDRICTEKALYFTDYESSQKHLMEYSFDSHVERAVVTFPYIYGTEAMSYYDNKIFVMLGNDVGYRIGYVDLVSEQYKEVESNIFLNDKSIKKYKNGWLFAEKEGDFAIKFFDFKTLNIVTLAMGCGYKKREEGGFFSKGYTLNLPRDFQKIGNWVYFEQGEKGLKVKVAIDRPMEVEPLGEPL